ncbi:hypothetical protein GW17_00042745, partial [Ensete ventricosum]
MASASLTSHETEDTKIRSKSIITGSSLAIGEESEEAGGDAVGEYYKQKHHPYKKGSSLLFPPSFWARKGGQMVWQKEAIKVGEGMCALRRCTLHEMPDVRPSSGALPGRRRRCLMRLTTWHVSTGCRCRPDCQVITRRRTPHHQYGRRGGKRDSMAPYSRPGIAKVGNPHLQAHASPPVRQAWREARQH